MRDGESLQSRRGLGIAFHAGLAYKSLAREYGGNTVCTCVQVHASAGALVSAQESSAQNREAQLFEQNRESKFGVSAFTNA